MDVGASFGLWVKKRRKALDLTQNALAKRVGCSAATIEKLEADQRRPSLQIAELLAEALEILPLDRPIFLKVARGERITERISGISPPATQPHLTNLPTPPTPLIGRTLELAEISRLLADPDCRLLTLVGTGGIGKTRLAIKAAADQQNVFSDGVYFVGLAGVNDVEFIPLAIAEALNLHYSGPTAPQQQLMNYILEKKLLLVLDNFEHLLPGVDLIVEILNQAGNVKLLVTSREPLDVHGEWLFDVQGLPIPKVGIGDASANSAVMLFAQSARRVHASYQLEKDDLNAVVMICRLMEGMPLGIELAAAWARTLTSREIAQEIERNLNFLSVSKRGIPERHRSLKAVFDHSWNLLNPDEQCMLQQISVFRGGFTRSAAEYVAGTSLSLLSSLISKSLVRRIENGRYDLHEAVRQIAYSHLMQVPDHFVTIDQYCEFYLSLLRDREPSLKSAAQLETIGELTREIDNIREAWGWAIQRDKIELIGQALRCFGWLSNIVGWLQEGIDQVETVVQALRTGANDKKRQMVLGLALSQQGLLSFRQGRFDTALPLYQEALAILQPLGQAGVLAEPLVVSGIINHLIGNMDRSKRLLAEGLSYSQEAGDRWIGAYAIFNQGYVTSLIGRNEEGYKQMLEGLALMRTIGDPSFISVGLNFISPIAILLGHFEEARSYLEESLKLTTQVGDWWGMGTAYRNLGLVFLVTGDYLEARSMLKKSLDIFAKIVIGWDIIRTLDYLGRVSAADGSTSEARQTFLSALYLSVDMRITSLVPDILVGLASLHVQAGEYEQALLLSLCASKDSASVQETKDKARLLAAEAVSHLPAQQADLVSKKATHKSPQAVVAEILEGKFNERPGGF